MWSAKNTDYFKNEFYIDSAARLKLLMLNTYSANTISDPAPTTNWTDSPENIFLRYCCISTIDFGAVVFDRIAIFIDDQWMEKGCP